MTQHVILVRNGRFRSTVPLPEALREPPARSMVLLWSESINLLLSGIKYDIRERIQCRGEWAEATLPTAGGVSAASVRSNDRSFDLYSVSAVC